MNGGFGGLVENLYDDAVETTSQLLLQSSGSKYLTPEAEPYTREPQQHLMPYVWVDFTIYICASAV